VRDILTVFHWLLQRRAGETAPQPLLTTTEVRTPQEYVSLFSTSLYTTLIIRGRSCLL
jgi:hypothetical protein